MEEVLSWYGLSLLKENGQEVTAVLVELGGQLQTAEMCRLTEAPDTLLGEVDDREWTLKEIHEFNKRFLKKLREQRERENRGPYLGHPRL